MAISKSIRQSIRKPIRQNIRMFAKSPISIAVTEVLIKLDRNVKSHYKLLEPIVETGDFEWSFELTIPKYSVHIVADSDDSALSRIGLQWDGTEITVWIASVASNFWGNVKFPALTAAAGDNKLHALSLFRDGDVFMLLLDGVLLGSKTASGHVMRATSIGALKGDSTALGFFDGIISKSDFGNGRKWKLNQLSGIYEITEGAVIGNELAVNDWASPRAHSAVSKTGNVITSVSDGDVTFGASTRLDNLTVGNIYNVRMLAKKTGEGGFYPRVAPAIALGSALVKICDALVYPFDVAIDAIFTATAEVMHVGAIGTGGGVITLESVSVKEVNPADVIKYKNIPESNRQTFTYDEQGRLIGEDGTVIEVAS